jgi:hypothetical protein
MTNISGEARTVSPMPPRVTLLACGTLAFTMYCWTGTIAASAPQPLGTLIHTAWLGGSIALLLLAVLATNLQTESHAVIPVSYRLTSRILLVLLGLTAVLTIAMTFLTIQGISRANPHYASDSAAFNQFNAQLIVRGVNPYTADNQFWVAIGQFPYVGATPLDRGRYATPRYDPYGPGLGQVARDVQQELYDPATRGPEYDPATLHSYPALAFLVYVPNVFAGWPSTAPTGALFLALFLLVVAWGTPPAVRLYIILILVANQFLLLGALRGDFESIAYFPAVAAWVTLDRRRLSPLLLGLAAAVKQLVWPLVPLYCIIVWRRSGWRAALERLGLITVSFLLPNVPFLLSSPSAWMSGLFLPMTLPLFPAGISLIGLAHIGLLPLLPPLVYALLEIAALAALMLWYAVSPTPPPPELALLLSLLPFLLAWRSLLVYFLVLPVLAVYATLPHLTSRPRLSQPSEVLSTSPNASLPPAAVHEVAFQSAAAPLAPAPTSASAAAAARAEGGIRPASVVALGSWLASWRSRCSWSSPGSQPRP